MPTILITGADTELGANLTNHFVKMNWTVVTVGEVEANLSKRSTSIQAARELLALGDKETIDSIKAAVGDELSVYIDAKLPERADPDSGSLAEAMSHEFAIDVSAPLRLMEALLPQLERHGAHVIMLATDHDQLSEPTAMIRSSIQAARVSLMRSAAVTFGNKGIGANALVLDPSSQDSIDEMVRTVAFLAENKVRFLHGTAIRLTGPAACRLHDPA